MKCACVMGERGRQAKESGQGETHTLLSPRTRPPPLYLACQSPEQREHFRAGLHFFEPKNGAAQGFGGERVPRQVDGVGEKLDKRPDRGGSAAQ